jgi:hypothetical protein
VAPDVEEEREPFLIIKAQSRGLQQPEELVIVSSTITVLNHDACTVLSLQGIPGAK